MNEKFEYVKVDVGPDEYFIEGHYLKMGTLWWPYNVDYLGFRIPDSSSLVTGCAAKSGQMEIYTRQPVPPKKYRLEVKESGGRYVVYDGDRVVMEGAAAYLAKDFGPGNHTIIEGYEG